MSGAKPGFSLIEIIVAITIIAIMAAILIPRLRMRGTRDLDALVDHIAALTSLGYERAIMTGKIHRIMFHMKEPAQIELQVMRDEKLGESEHKFVRAEADYDAVSFDWSDQLSVKNFYIKGFDEAAKGNLKDAWFYLLPNGMSQEIIINIVDEKTNDERGLVLNPFHGTFTSYDTFQKP